MSKTKKIGPSTPFQAAAFDRAEGLYVDRKEEWGEAIGLPPEKFHALWTNDMPGKPKLDLELTGGGQGNWSLHTPELDGNGHFDRSRSYIFIDEIRIGNESLRRRGAGKKFLSNLVDACREWGLNHIELRGGREDGAYFWSRRGFYIQPWYVERFKTDIRENLAGLGDKVPAAVRDQVNDILDHSGPEVNIRLARLEDAVDGVPVGLTLLRLAAPARMDLFLDNPEQMQLARKGLKSQQDQGPPAPAPVMV
jgi:GNAT superfamily N-acetyltransferase